MDLEHQQKLSEMNREFENLMNYLQTKKLEELNQRIIETENFLKQLKSSNDIEMKKMEEEKVKNKMYINQQIEIIKQEIENKQKEHQEQLIKMDLKHKENIKSIENNHNENMEQIKKEREKK